jgi:flagellin
MSVINTNVKALIAQDSIVKNNRTLSTAMERLSTGSRINSAKDDAAGLAISTRMDSQIRGLSMAVRNANDGISLMQTAEGAMDEVNSILQRMRELAVQAVNGTNNDSDRVALNDEVAQLKTEIDRIASTTEFNSQKILDGSFKDKKLQIGDKAYQTLDVAIDSVATKDLGMASGSFGGDTIVGTRMALDDFDKGDIKINGQDLEAFDYSEEGLAGLLENINENVDNVTASAFNTVVAKNIGTGITDDDDFQIKVTGPGTNTETLYKIAASSNLEELVANINSQAGAEVQASINDDGKLVLSNTTGATISILDTTEISGYETASGFQGSAATFDAFNGFLKLESKDGNPVRVERGNPAATSPGSLDDLNTLGFMEVTSTTNSANDAYTVTGAAFSAATAVTTEWGQTDLKINGVRIYDEDIDTSSFSGKLEAINNFSDETGVIAYAHLDTTLTFSAGNFESAVTTGMLANHVIQFNGTTVFTAVGGGADTMDDLVEQINAASSATGISATAEGYNLRLVGSNVQSLQINMEGASGTAVALADLTQGDLKYGSIRLDSVKNQPISIELGDNTTAGTTGFMESNVGAADFMVNAAQLGVASGGSLQGLNVRSQTAATAAISVIDNAIEAVSSSRSKLGAMQNRLNNTVNNLTNVVTNTSASRSRIQDTDYAQETTKLAKAQIIQQAATAMLAQANQQPQSVLSLLQ